MLSKIDLIIIEGFLTKNMDKFNKFCIDECLGTAGTGKATLKHVVEALKTPNQSLNQNTDKTPVPG